MNLAAEASISISLFSLALTWGLMGRLDDYGARDSVQMQRVVQVDAAEDREDVGLQEGAPAARAR